MTETEIQTFVDGTVGYFNSVNGEKASIGLPYPTGNDTKLLDYTGAIGVSGNKKGCVYITSTRGMLTKLVSHLIGNDSPTEEDLEDMAGELANTIAGNARQVFGTGFQISTPIIIKGKKNGIRLPLVLPVFEIPFTWASARGFMVVGLAPSV